MDATSRMFRNLIRNIDGCHTVDQIDNGRIKITSVALANNNQLRVIRDSASEKVIVFLNNEMIPYKDC